MNKGALLKFHRNRTGFSQEELAEGVVSPSYLSKIENNQTQAADETLDLLFRKIGFDLSEVKEKEHEVKDLLNNWEAPLLANDVESAQKLKNKIDHYVENILSIEVLLDYYVKLIRFYILAADFSKIEEVISMVKMQEDELSNRSAFFFYKHMGNYLMNVNDSENAEKFFGKAVLIYTQNLLSDLEKADLFYLFSICLARLRKDAIGLEYAKEALGIYRDHYLLVECTKTHIQLGASLSRIQHFDIAEEHYKKARELAYQLNLNNLLGIIEHNIANMYLKKNDTKNAILSLEKCLKYKSEQINSSYFSSLILLISVHFDEDQLEDCQYWLKKGIQQKGNKLISEVQEYEVNFYYKLLSRPMEEWELFINNDFIPFLQANNKWYHLTKYSKIIAGKYKNHFQYKKSTKFFELAINAYENINKF